MDLEPEPQPRESSNATVIYMVSVYLLLIAFFVILHTVSKKEDVKTAAVVGSLRVTFQRPEIHTEAPLRDADVPRFSGVNQEFRDRVIELFSSFITSSRFSMVEGGNALRVALEPNDIFYAGTATLRADRIDLMRQVAEMLTNPQPYRRNSIDIWLESVAPGGVAAGKSLEVRRAGVLARDLVANQVSPGHVTIGLTQGGGGGLFMTFSTQPADPAGGAGE